MTEIKREQKLNLWQKIGKVQSEVNNLKKTELNKFQNYNYFTELQVLEILRPLLKKYELSILISDVSSSEFKTRKEGNNYLVEFLKECELINCDNEEERISLNFWACGQNNDLAKAKGSADTYAVKYFLSKLFLMPVSENDLDIR